MQPGLHKNNAQLISPSLGRLTNKIHSLVNGLGILAHFSLNGAQATDTGERLLLLGEFKPLRSAANNAYNTNTILQHLKSLGVQGIIPSKENRLEQCRLDKNIYSLNNLIERFFCSIK